jgi:hypothetical protein
MIFHNGTIGVKDACSNGTYIPLGELSGACKFIWYKSLPTKKKLAQI